MAHDLQVKNNDWDVKHSIPKPLSHWGSFLNVEKKVQRNTTKKRLKNGKTSLESQESAEKLRTHRHLDEATNKISSFLRHAKPQRRGPRAWHAFCYTKRVGCNLIRRVCMTTSTTFCWPWYSVTFFWDIGGSHFKVLRAQECRWTSFYHPLSGASFRTRLQTSYNVNSHNWSHNTESLQLFW